MSADQTNIKLQYVLKLFFIKIKNENQLNTGLADKIFHNTNLRIVEYTFFFFVAFV